MLSAVVGLVSDINQVDTSPTDLTEVNGKLFFVTTDSAAGTQSLWATDGTTQGTAELSSIGQITSSSPSSPPGSTAFVALNGMVYFTSDDANGNPALFKTDGTVAGTVEVAPLGYLPNSLTAAGGKIYISESAPSGSELWTSDGTANGTIELNAFSSDSGPISDITGVGDSIDFTVAGNLGDEQLWTSDSTPTGTVELEDFGGSGSVTSLTAFGGALDFIVQNGMDGDQLWTTDGTAAGTMALTQFDNISLQTLQVLNGSLYLVGSDSGSSTDQLWTSDGTAAGTVAVTATGGTFSTVEDLTAVGSTIFFVNSELSATSPQASSQLWEINGGIAAPVTPSTTWVAGPSDLTALNDTTLLFMADDGNGDGDELWKSDGTAAGTTMVQDINPGPDGSYLNSFPNISAYSQSTFSVIDGVAYFAANGGTDGDELWRTDGTHGGTSMVDDIDPGPASSSPQELTDVNGTLYFVAHDGSGSNQLWKSDGTAAGTTMVQSFSPVQNQGSSPSNLTVVNGTLYFSANDGIHGNQLWKSDGTAAGTTIVSDLGLADDLYDSQALSSFVGLNGTLYFEAGDATDAAAGFNSIYRSDGTPGGTYPIFTPDSSNESMTGLIVSGNSLYFLTNESDGSGTDVDLWKSNGTASGTVLVTSIQNSYNPDTLTAANGTLYFETQTNSPAPNGDSYQLWKSDGTASGTTEVSPIPGAVQDAVVLGSQLVFIQGGSPWSGGSGNSLWVSNGTARGTFQLQDFQPSDFGYGNGISSLTLAGGKLYFVAQGGSDTQLWTTNGTIAGTTPLTTENSGSGGVDPSNLVNLNGTLFFTADDPANSEEALWSSDGTTNGTTIVTDLAGSSNPYTDSYSQPMVSANQLFFAGSSSSPSSGPLWQSDGTASGTQTLASLPQSATNLTLDGNTLFFTASDDRGTELWSAQLPQTPTPTPPPASTVNPIVESNPTVPSTPTPTPTKFSIPTPNSTPVPTSTPAPTPTSIIMSEQPTFRRRLNKRGKPTGRPELAGFSLKFSRPMAPSAGNAANYEVYQMPAKGTKGKLEKLAGVSFTVTYNTSTNTATLNLASGQTFPRGGLLTVSTAVAGAAGESLSGDHTFTISKGAKAIGAA
ncbi:MAG: ELWxxDGT repeat protein [Isosphaeraceae bacterium]